MQKAKMKRSQYAFRLIVHESVRYAANVERTRPEAEEYIRQAKEKKF